MESHVPHAQVTVLPDRHTGTLARQQDAVAQPTEVNEGRFDANTQLYGAAPIDTLPNELLFAIVEMACHHDFPRCRHNPGGVLDSALAISQTSQRWRAIALAEHSMWACIHIGPVHMKNAYKRLELQLERAGSASPSVVFTCKIGKHDQATYGLYLQSWRRLWEHKISWRCCAIAVNREGCMGELLHMMPQASPNLDTLCLISLSKLIVVTQEMALRAPVPRRLHVRGVSIYRLKTGLFKQLTELKMTNLTDIHPHPLLSFLAEQTPNLKSLVLAIMTLTVFNPNIQSPAVSSFPKLEHLALTSMRRDVTFEILANTLYAAFKDTLKTLHLGIDYHTDVALRPLQTGALLLPLVHTFELVDYRIPRHLYYSTFTYRVDQPSMRRIADTLPSVEVFEAHPSATEFLAFLVGCDEAAIDGSVAWPALHTLRLSKVDEGTLVRFLEPRAAVQRPVRTLMLHPSLRTELSGSSLEMCAALGASIYFTYQPHFVDDEDFSLHDF